MGNLVGASAISGLPFLDGERMFTSILSLHWPGCFSALGRGVSWPWMVGIDFVIGHWQFGQCEWWPIFLHTHISVARKIPQAQIQRFPQSLLVPTRHSACVRKIVTHRTSEQTLSKGTKGG